MLKSFDKKHFKIASIVFLLFCGAGIILLLFFKYFFQPYSTDASGLPITTIDFNSKVFPHLLDLGKFFLTILVGVFVASLTFSEKIVNFQSTSVWAKSLLILCWLFLLLSIVCDGVGIVFLTTWYANESVEHNQQNMSVFQSAFYCFGFAGINFGLALTSMLTSGVISFLASHSKDEATPSVQPQTPAPEPTNTTST